MSRMLESVDKRTQLVGQNRLELLLFRLNGSQVYGINVFKVKEVIQCPKLTMLPKRNPVVVGVAHIRGGTVPVLDLNMATGQRPLDDIYNCFAIITEYNMVVQGFLVKSVERIVNTNWEDIHPPPAGAGKENYLTAVTEIDDRLVEIIDVEKILSEVAPRREDVTAELMSEKQEMISKVKETKPEDEEQELTVLIVDDSAIARKQLVRCVENLGLESVTLNDGRAALNYLKTLAEDGVDVSKKFFMVISDIEMPEMDGYTLTTSIRNDPRLANLHIMLHTSLSGVFNNAMVEKVGANEFLAKFHPDELAERITARLETFIKENEH